MSLAVLIPYRPDSPTRVRIYEFTSRLWARRDVRVVHCSDERTGPFCLPRAANLGRSLVDTDAVLIYSVDALPLSPERLDKLDVELSGGTPWATVFEGQQRFTPEQTERLLAGADPLDVGPPVGRVSLGHEAIIGVRTDVWDELQGMDERFVGWGPEDRAFHRALALLHPTGRNIPTGGLFESMEHPDTPRGVSYRGNAELWERYLSIKDPATMREFYLSRPGVRGGGVPAP